MACENDQLEMVKLLTSSPRTSVSLIYNEKSRFSERISERLILVESYIQLIILTTTNIKFRKRSKKIKNEEEMDEENEYQKLLNLKRFFWFTSSLPTEVRFCVCQKVYNLESTLISERDFRFFQNLVISALSSKK